MDFGMQILPRDTRSALEEAESLEAAGFGYAGIADSQTLYREMYATMGAVAGTTSRITLATSVTNPSTRHPAVTASAIATVNELSGGRAVAGVGSGDSAVLSLGLQPSRLGGFRDFVTALRSLLRGESTDYQGTTLHPGWLSDLPSPVPVYVAAEGPKTLEMAGQVADGVICGLGLSAEAVDYALSHIARGAAASGRSMDELDVWFFARVNIGSDRDALIDEIRMELASTAHHVFRESPTQKLVPDALLDELLAVRDGYNPLQHEVHGESGNARLMRNKDVLDYFVERFAIVGTAEECRTQLEAIRAYGVDGVLFTGFVSDRKSLISQLEGIIKGL